MILIIGATGYLGNIPVAAPPELSPLTVQLMTLSSPVDFTQETARTASEFGIRQTSFDEFLKGMLTKAA